MSDQKLDSPTLAVVELLADKKDVDPVDLWPPLHNVVDTEALDRVIQSLDGDGYIEFQYQDYQVRVFSNNEIRLVKKVPY